MKTIHEELRFDRPADQVFALIATGAFQLEVIAHIGGHDGELMEEDVTAGGGVRLVTRQRTGVELPGFAKKLIPANTTVVQTYEWGPPAADGTREGTWAAEVKGAPVSMSGPTALRTDGAGCLQLFEGQVKASVPLVGGKLESFALDNLRQDLARTRDFAAARLMSR